MEEKKACLCGTSEFNVVCCSGASDLGQLSDLVSRKLRDNQVRKMNCLAMVAIGNEPLISSLKLSNVLVIDGCPVDCGRKILEQAGMTSFVHLRLTDLGYVKGKTSVTEATTQEIYEKAELLY